MSMHLRVTWVHWLNHKCRLVTRWVQDRKGWNHQWCPVWWPFQIHTWQRWGFLEWRYPQYSILFSDFPWNKQSSYWGTHVYNTLRAHHQECVFHMRMRALVAAPFEYKPTDSQTHSPLPNCEETNCNGLCLGRHVARKQARGVEPHVDKLQGDHATRNYCSSNPHVNKGSRPSHLWLRPSYVPILPSKPHVNKGLRLPSVVTPLVRPDYAPPTRM